MNKNLIIYKIRVNNMENSNQTTPTNPPRDLIIPDFSELSRAVEIVAHPIDLGEDLIRIVDPLYFSNNNALFMGANHSTLDYLINNNTGNITISGGDLSDRYTGFINPINNDYLLTTNPRSTISTIVDVPREEEITTLLETVENAIEEIAETTQQVNQSRVRLSPSV